MERFTKVLEGAAETIADAQAIIDGNVIAEDSPVMIEMLAEFSITAGYIHGSLARLASAVQTGGESEA